MITYSIILKSKYMPTPKTVEVEAENATEAIRKAKENLPDGGEVLNLEIVKVNY